MRPLPSMPIVVCALLGAAAAQATAADLLAVYREAQKTDAVFAAARASLAAGQEKLPQGLSGLLPAVTVSGNTLYNDRDLQFRNGTPSANSRYNSNALSVTATQPLFRAQNWISYEQSRHQVSQAEAVFVQAGQDLMLRTAQAYFDVLVAENNVALAMAQRTAYAEQLAQAKRNFEVGTATITDANDAQARHDLAYSQEIGARNDLEVKKQALRQITGSVPPALARIRPGFTPQLPAPDSMEAWVEQSATSSPQLKAAHMALEVASREVARNRGAHLPTLDAVASYADSAQGAGIQGGPGFDSATRYIGVQLAVPLYQGGLVNSRVREALANEEKSRQELENARRNVAQSTRAAFLGVTSGVAQIKALEAALVSSQSSLDSTKLGQEVGVRTQVDVLNAQQQLISTRRDYAQAVYAYTVNVLKLKAAAGTLAEADLAFVNQWLGD